MSIQRPTPEDVRKAALEIGLHLNDQDMASFHALMQGQLDAYDFVDTFTNELPTVKYARTPGYRPAAAENPFNAWAVKSHIRGSGRGKLVGKRVAIKDNVCVAGIPMTNGTDILQGFIPEIDATIVTRLLDEGADILGTATCEYYCASGGSHTSWYGPVENPIVPGYNAGGSSSGSTALVVSGQVDMATGGDQGGSIRIPASYCGAVGLKPTHGLVPYTGIFAVELTLDHVGPITRTVYDNALMLEVMAGPDGLDPRQHGVAGQNYTQALTAGIHGLKIGIVPEGFGMAGAEEEVDERIREAADLLKGAGARLVESSIPLHRAGAAIWTPVFLEGATELMMRHNAYGTNMKGIFLEGLLDAQYRWRDMSDGWSETMKLGILTGHYMSSRHRGRFYGKAQNVARSLTAQYDRALEAADVLLMPTTPMAATPLPKAGAPREVVIGRAFEMVSNTAPTCLTGHPAISVPAGRTKDGRPIGAMLIARHNDEMTLFRAAAALEALYP